MKRSVVLKTLIDILYYLHCLGLLFLIVVVLFGSVEGVGNVTSEAIDPTQVVLMCVGIMVYVLFLIGLNYLRKMGGFLLTEEYFSEKLIAFLRKAGNYFVLTGVLSLVYLLISWIVKLYNGKLLLSYDIEFIIPFFLIIVGLFFIIQSHALVQAGKLKLENDLTI